MFAKKLSFLLLMLAAATTQSLAITLFSTTFDIDVTGKSAFENNYPDFSFSSSENNIRVNNGVLEIGSNSSFGRMDALINGFDGDLHISLGIGALTGGSNYHVGLIIGLITLLFHPLPPGGAFFVKGPGGFTNMDMGFTLSANVLHFMEIDIDGTTGRFDITVTDGINANNIFTASFTNLGSIGGMIGLHRDGIRDLRGVGIGLYDNLMVTTPGGTVIPEPSTIALFSVGLLGLIAFRKKFKVKTF